MIPEIVDSASAVASSNDRFLILLILLSVAVGFVFWYLLRFFLKQADEMRKEQKKDSADREEKLLSIIDQQTQTMEKMNQSHIKFNDTLDRIAESQEKIVGTQEDFQETQKLMQENLQKLESKVDNMKDMFMYVRQSPSTIKVQETDFMSG